ncbi:MAG: oligosaccharide flippase family protein [Acidobacteria bacterium]|nr:oligosaccharide flippase family protein [Acidobacteriota bacterium]
MKQTPARKCSETVLEHSRERFSSETGRQNGTNPDGAPQDLAPGERESLWRNVDLISLMVSLPHPGPTARFLWALAGNVFQAASQWMLVVLLSRLGTPLDVGRFSLGLAITSPILAATNLQLRAVQATDTEGKFDFGHFAALRVLGTVAFLVVTLLAVSLLRNDQGAVFVVLAVAIVRSADSFGELAYGLMHHKERLDWIAHSQTAKAIAALAAMYVVFVASGSLLYSILTIATCQWVLCLAVDLPLMSASKPQAGLRPIWESAELFRLFRLALPLGATLLFGALNASIPRYFLKHCCGDRDVGLYSTMAYASIGGSLLVMAMGQALAPRMARAYVSNQREYRRLSRFLIGFAALAGILMVGISVVWGRQFLAILYGDEYSKSEYAFIILTIGSLCSMIGSAVGCCLTSAHHYSSQLPSLVAATMATTLTSALLAPAQGIDGAAFGHLAGYAVHAAGVLAWYMLMLSPRSAASDCGANLEQS